VPTAQVAPASPPFVQDHNFARCHPLEGANSRVNATHRRLINQMKRLIVTGVLAAALIAPAGAQSDPPSSTDFKNASKECKALRSAMGTENFRNTYGTGKNKRNAHGRCVSKKAREEQGERVEALKNAAKECKAERNDPNFAATHDGKSFNEFYGTNKNGKNAYGKCVSQKAKQNKQEADQQDQNRVNAARECRTEQKDPNFAATHDNKSFSEFYGTNANNRNAFGKCVSAKARAKNEQQQQS
jgi:hypothetical protein